MGLEKLLGKIGAAGDEFLSAAKGAATQFDEFTKRDPIEIQQAVNDTAAKAGSGVLKGIAAGAGFVKDAAENPQATFDTIKAEALKTRDELNKLFERKPPGGDGPSVS